MISGLPEQFSPLSIVGTEVPKPPVDNGGQGEDFGKSSPLGFLILIVLLIAVVILVRSMTKHLKRVPKSFDSEESISEKERSN